LEPKAARISRPLSNPLIRLKTGAGEGIRTLDPNLGNGPERPTPQYPAVSITFLTTCFIYLLFKSSPPNTAQNIRDLALKSLFSAYILPEL